MAFLQYHNEKGLTSQPEALLGERFHGIAALVGTFEFPPYPFDSLVISRRARTPWQNCSRRKLKMVKVDRREARRPGEETILIRLGKVVEAIIR